MKLEPNMVAVAIGSALIGALAVTAWQTRGSFYECVVAEMRGQRIEMRSTVARLCRERYPERSR